MIERKYMERALQLASNGEGFTSPNPMVGAVIVSPQGRIIGEGWHRRYGGPHAEVNAVNSVAKEDEHLLEQSTIYVTLEPCSHYGKTPPCSLLLINKHLKRVVVGSPDPFPLVSGRGIRMLREAGIEVVENFMREECDRINRRFLTAHTLGRPFIQLKWAESSDGFIGATGRDGKKTPVALSTPLSLAAMHRQRALADAILVGTETIITDNPSLTLRLWPGRDPRPVVFQSERIPQSALLLKRDPIFLHRDLPLSDEMNRLYREYGIISLMVEGGAATLRSFINARLADEIRVEHSPRSIGRGVEAPAIPAGFIITDEKLIGTNRITTYEAPASSKSEPLE